MLPYLVRRGQLLACHSRSAIRYFRTMSPLQQGKSAHEGDSRSPGALSEMKNNATTVDPLVFDRHREEGATALMKERLEHTATRDEINEAFGQGLKSGNMARDHYRGTISPQEQGKSGHDGASRSRGALSEMENNAATMDPLVFDRYREEGATESMKERLEHTAIRDEVYEAFRQGFKSGNMARDSYGRTMSLRQRRKSAYEGASPSPGASSEMENNAATVDPWVRHRDRDERQIARLKERLKERLEHPGPRDEFRDAITESMKQSLELLTEAREFEDKYGFRVTVLV